MKQEEARIVRWLEAGPIRMNEYSKKRIRSYDEQITPLWKSKNVLLAGMRNREQSCQASSILWCEFALKGKQKDNPHLTHKKAIFDLMEFMSPFWKWGNYGFWYKHMSMCLKERNLKGAIKADGGRDDCIKKLYNDPAVYIIMSTGYHIVAASTLNRNMIYHYDNDVGLARFKGIEAWECWVKDVCGEITGENYVKSAIWRCMKVTL